MSHFTILLVSLILWAVSIHSKAYSQEQKTLSQVVMPDNNKMILLIRSSMLTLNDAILTGNFTVLRDRGSPQFRNSNTSAKLSLVFQPLIEQNIDLSFVAVATPKWSSNPTLDTQQLLSINGVFAAKPAAIEFYTQFVPVNGNWKLYNIGARAVQKKSIETPGKGISNTPKN